MKHILTLALIAISFTNTFAQSSSPYSRFGYGNLLQQEQAHLKNMGYLSSAYVDTVQNNLANPAALGSKKFSSLDLGLNIDYHTQKDKDNKANFTSGRVSYLAYSFPVNKKKTWGMAVGTAPFSTKKYNITSEEVNNTFYRDFNGQGGTYQFFLQNGAKLSKNLALGINTGIFFGTLKDETYNNFLSNGANSSGLRTKQKLRGYAIEAGGQYTAQLKEKQDLILGVTYRLETDIKNTRTEDNFLFTIAQFEKLQDGSINVLKRNEFSNIETTTKSEIILPSEFGFGAMLRTSEKWSLGVDAKFGLWENFKSINDGNSIKYQNSMSLNLGGSFIPKYRNPKRSFEAFEYRYGAHYRQLPFQINEKAINDFGITLGASLPIKRSMPGSRIREIPSIIDLGLNFGQQGSLNDGLVQDSYLKGSVGLNLNDIWFVKRKYD